MSKSATTSLVGAALVCAALANAAPARADNTKICVDISLQRASKKPAAAPAPQPKPAPPPPKEAPDAPAEAAKAPPPSPPPEPVNDGLITPGSEGDVLPRELQDKRGTADGLPIGQRPLAYLKRLIEHFVSHEKGFVAVQSGCEHRIVVELYPLTDGWTAFVRYSGTGREERVDRLLPDELSQFAERAATALLYGKPISATINRENVLVSDSREYAQRVRGSSHFVLGVGTQIRAGKLATTVTAAGDPRKGDAVEQWRVLSPVSAYLGYRGRFESWGLETIVMSGIGTAKTTATNNPGGGHIDFTTDGALQLHFLHYTDPRGLTSFYAGAGSTFELLVFQAINPKNQRTDGTRSYLLGGGVDVDLVLGWEFMRASSAQFFLQAEAQLPAYMLSNENASGGLHTWFPALGFKLGVML
jgi:hypothetical protein